MGILESKTLPSKYFKAINNSASTSALFLVRLQSPPKYPSLRDEPAQRWCLRLWDEIPREPRAAPSPAAVPCQCRAVPLLPWALTPLALPARTPNGPVKRESSHCLDAGEAPETQKHPAQTMPPALSSGDFSLMAWRLILCRERKSKGSGGRPTHVTPIKSSSAND